MIAAVMPTYARAELTFEKGEGAYIHDTDGRRYLDFGAGIAVTGLGHCHPHLVKALTEQAAKVWHTSNLYHIPGQERLAQRLVDNSFADSVFFTNSGGEAVECGAQDGPQVPRRKRCPRALPGDHLRGAFHGRSLAAIAAGRQAKHTQGFEPLVDGFDQVPFGNLNELRAAIGPETAGILVEPVQGEGGIRPAAIDYLKGLRQTADEFGLVLMFDEVQCGMGRTGRLFAHEWAGIAPDVLASAKALGGGFPVGACLATEPLAAAMKAGSHGSTFGGNPLAMAVANAVLDVILADGFLEGVERIAGYLKGKLEALVAARTAVLVEVRGSGLMLGLKCVGENTALIAELIANGMLAIAAGDNVVRLVPPLIIEEAHVDKALAILEKSCAALEGRGE